MSTNDHNLEADRHAAQLAFVDSGAPLVVGSLAGFPLDLDALKALRPGAPAIERTIDSGLTAQVHRLRAGESLCTLKRAYPVSRVRNLDGQTSFLNEVQRRADLEVLKRAPGGERRWAGIVDTVFASYRDGILLSPWIVGEHVDHWDERRLSQLFELACDLWLEGLFSRTGACGTPPPRAAPRPRCSPGSMASCRHGNARCAAISARCTWPRTGVPTSWTWTAGFQVSSAA
jgi:hypothetical protein